MDTTAFATNRSEFNVLDFVARYSWRTATSISFLLGRYCDSLKLADRDEPFYVGTNKVFKVFGWLEIHHPCEDHIKARIRAKLSPDLMQFETQRTIIEVVFDALGIPRDETFEAGFFETTSVVSISSGH